MNLELKGTVTRLNLTGKGNPSEGLERKLVLTLEVDPWKVDVARLWSMVGLEGVKVTLEHPQMTLPGFELGQGLFAGADTP